MKDSENSKKPLIPPLPESLASLTYNQVREELGTYQELSPSERFYWGLKLNEKIKKAA
jgi:hypothetical protein